MKVTQGLPITPYLDDIIAPTSTSKDNLKLLEDIFMRLRTAKFKLKPSKCVFLKKDINYLGFVIKDHKVLPEHQKIEAVENAQFPSTVKGLQRFLGLSNFLSRFVPHYAEISSPLTTLQNKSQSDYSQCIKGNNDVRVSFDRLKAKIVKISPLKFKNQFCLNVDASNIAIGSILHHEHRLIVFYSRWLTNCEKN